MAESVETKEQEVSTDGLVRKPDETADAEATDTVAGGADGEKVDTVAGDSGGNDGGQVQSDKDTKPDDRFSKPLQKLQQEFGNLQREHKAEIEALRKELSAAKAPPPKDDLDAEDDDVDPYKATPVVVKRVKALEKKIEDMEAAHQRKLDAMSAQNKAVREAQFRSGFESNPEHKGLSYEAIKAETQKAIETELEPFQGEGVTESFFRYVADRKWVETVAKAKAALAAKPKVPAKGGKADTAGTRIVDSASAAHRADDVDDNGDPYTIEDKFVQGLLKQT